MATKIQYVRAENLSSDKRAEFGLPENGTVALEISVNSPVTRRYVKLPEKGFFEFLKSKVKEGR